MPYGGGGPAVQAVVGARANMTWLSFAALRGQISAGKIKPLAVTGLKRLPELPNVPTVAESGFPGFVAYSWSGMFAPKGTPEATVKKLTADFKAVLADPEIRKEGDRGWLRDRSFRRPALDAYVKSEYDRWSAFIKSSNINLDN